MGGVWHWRGLGGINSGCVTGVKDVAAPREEYTGAALNPGDAVVLRDDDPHLGDDTGITGHDEMHGISSDVPEVDEDDEVSISGVGAIAGDESDFPSEG